MYDMIFDITVFPMSNGIVLFVTLWLICRTKNQNET